jgi:hypothetical protein
MITIKNYDSRLPLSNYQMGDTYIFRIHNPNMKRLIKIKENDFKAHIETLKDTIETHKETINNNSQYLNFTESIGVVVDKHKSTTTNENDYITVVFKTPTDEFVINKYVVNYHHN